MISYMISYIWHMISYMTSFVLCRRLSSFWRLSPTIQTLLLNSMRHVTLTWQEMAWCGMHALSSFSTAPSETLFTLCRLLLQCTKVEGSPRYLGERSFSTLTPFHLTSESTQTNEQGHFKWICNSIVIGRANQSAFHFNFSEFWQSASVPYWFRVTFSIRLLTCYEARAL